MESVTINFRDNSTQPPQTEERVLVVYEDQFWGGVLGVSVDEKDAEDVTDDEYWIPLTELWEAICKAFNVQKGETHDAE
jgi:hypothetical protein